MFDNPNDSVLDRIVGIVEKERDDYEEYWEKRRKYELLLAMEHCHEFARSVFAGRIPNAKKYGLNSQQFALSLAKWLFNAKSHQLPKPPLPGKEWEFPNTSYYRNHIDDICFDVQATTNYG